jgi:arginyl-tRNA synthetase
MLFDPSESIDFNGNTGPFIQYTYARIQSVLRKCCEDYKAMDISAVAPNEKETSLIQRLADFTAVVADAGRNYSPALIANYIYDLAKEYNQFYHDCSILKEQDEKVRCFRQLLSDTVADVIKRGMSLLGIEMPNRM